MNLNGKKLHFPNQWRMEMRSTLVMMMSNYEMQNFWDDL